ncbi:transposase [Prevotella sp. PINT]|uniref:phage integrase SAM-like domain-containing protein n=1 Tax=Bacteroidales TaxID=171549 RepID=UPI001554615E|nr:MULTISPECIES: phage integrase SAM-like domain-containing protein [Bacteroidales]NPD83037.1 transposase [Palleniella intestinalis]
MATLRAIVKTKMRNGMYKVYIRFTHNRQFSYMRTSWMVNEKGLSDDKKDIIDPFVIQQTSILIEECYNKLNQVDTSKWSVKEVLEFVLEYEKDISFSDYARLHIDKMIKRGQERTSRNYKWALQHLEKFARTDNLMFSRLTSAFLNRWIETLSQTTTRSKEQYPVCIREIYKAAIMEFNDEERGLSKLNNPWSKVKIPRSDVPEKRAIPASKLRAFFNVVPDRSRFTNPLMEVGQDVALISFCMCGLNAVDIFNAKKDQYNNGIFHYERQKTRSTRSDRGYFEVRVPPFLKPTFEKYLSKKADSPWCSIFMTDYQLLILSAQM